MELRVLNYFLTVAQEENITKAAQVLHITQPTLSRQLMQLEEELGAKLFKRSNHSVVLTDEGMLLKRRAQELVALAEKTLREFQQSEQLSGELSVGSGEFQSFEMLAAILADFQAQYPLVQLELYSGNADDVKERLDNGLLDVGLLSYPVDIGKYDFLRLPQKETWGFLVPEDSKWGKKAYLTPKDLQGAKLMISPRALIQHELANWLGEYWQQVEVVATYNLLHNVAIMVQKKMGIAFCMDLASRYEGLCFVPIAPQWDMGMVLVWKKHQIFSQAVERFLTFAKEYLQGMSEDT